MVFSALLPSSLMKSTLRSNKITLLPTLIRKLASLSNNSLWMSRMRHWPPNPTLITPKASHSPTHPLSPSHSFTELRLPFRSSPSLFAHYQSSMGGVRIGKLLEDMDAFAALIAYKHAGDDHRMVTVAMDGFKILGELDGDLRMRGAVFAVGKRSLEIAVSVDVWKGDADDLDDSSNSSNTHQWDPCVFSKFTFVSKGVVEGEGDLLLKPKDLPPLSPTNCQQESFQNKFTATRTTRKASGRNSLTPPTPSYTDLLAIHKLLKQPSNNPANRASATHPTICAHKTKQSTLQICHPQDRNIHGTIFGGYLLRTSLELAFAICRNSGVNMIKPSLISIDKCEFHVPVQVGSLVRFDGAIIWSSPSSASLGVDDNEAKVCVRVQMYCDDQVCSEQTFTFACDPTQMTFDIHPCSYEEALLFLQAHKQQQTREIE